MNIRNYSEVDVDTIILIFNSPAYMFDSIQFMLFSNRCVVIIKTFHLHSLAFNTINLHIAPIDNIQDLTVFFQSKQGQNEKKKQIMNNMNWLCASPSLYFFPCIAGCFAKKLSCQLFAINRIVYYIELSTFSW